MTKERREKSKLPITRILQSFHIGDRVVLKPEPSYHKGMFHPRFAGKVALVKGKSGGCYVLKIRDGGKHKELIVHPVHLRGVTSGKT
jgi:large subunit ribosomal protein L21e